jgi:hypothetical protein
MKHVSRRNPERSNTLRGKPPVALLVPRGAEVMALAIDFYAKPRLMAVEIQDIRPRRMLLSKLEPRLLSAQLAPQQPLRK